MSGGIVEGSGGGGGAEGGSAGESVSEQWEADKKRSKLATEQPQKQIL